MGLGLFKALFCCSTSQEIEIVSSDSSPPRKQSRKTQQQMPSPSSPSRPRYVSQPSQVGPILGKPFVVITQLYEMKKELGRGQSGVTYLCVDKTTRKEYACKSIARAKLLSQQEIEDVRREVMILQHLSGQPNIVEFRHGH